MDTTPLEAAGAMSQEAAIRMLQGGDRVGFGFSGGDGKDDAVEFGVGQKNDKGQLTGGFNKASMTVLDTTNDMRIEARDHAPEIAAKNKKAGKLRAFAAKVGQSIPILGALAAAEKLPNLAPTALYFSRVLGRVVTNVTERSAEAKYLKYAQDKTKEDQGKSMNARYHDEILRLSQEIATGRDEVTGEPITTAVASTGENREAAKTEEQKQLETDIKDQIAKYLENVSTIMPNDQLRDYADYQKADQEAVASGNWAKELGKWYKNHPGIKDEWKAQRAAYKAERSDPDFQQAERDKLQAELTTKVDAYNAMIHKGDKSLGIRADANRGMFSTNNFMELAEAAKNALDAGKNLANVKRGIDKVNLVFAEVASPVPEERMSRVDAAANKIYNTTHGLVSVETAGVVATAIVGGVSAFAQGGLTMTAGKLPFVGTALTAGAFSGWSEAKRLKKERNRAARKNAYSGSKEALEKEVVGLQQQIDSIGDPETGKLKFREKRQIKKLQEQLNEKEAIRNSLMETKSANEISKGLETQRALLFAAMKKKQPISAELRQSVLSSLADIDQRLQEQVASGTPLISYTDRKHRDSEYWAMRKKRSELQDMLAASEVVASGIPRSDTERVQEAMAEARDRVGAEVAEQNARYMGTESQRLNAERHKADQVFAALKRNKALKAAGKTSLTIGLFTLIGPAGNKLGQVVDQVSGAGIGSTVATAAKFVGRGALLFPNAKNEAVQTARSFNNTKEEQDHQRVVATYKKLGYSDKEIRMVTKMSPEEAAQYNRNRYQQMTGTTEVNAARPETETGPETTTAPVPTPTPTPPAAEAEAAQEAENPDSAENNRREAIIERETADRNTAEQLFFDRTGVRLPEAQLGSLFWDSFVASSKIEGIVPTIGPDGISFDPQAVAQIMVERYNAENQHIQEVELADAIKKVAIGRNPNLATALSDTDYMTAFNRFVDTLAQKAA
jgi:hypothetical protein